MSQWPLATLLGLVAGTFWAWRLQRLRKRGNRSLWPWPLAVGLLCATALVASFAGWLRVYQYAGLVALLWAATMGIWLLILRSRHDKQLAGQDHVTWEVLWAERRWTDDLVTMLAASIVLLVCLPLLDEPAARSVVLAGCVAVAVITGHALYVAIASRRRPDSPALADQQQPTPGDAGPHPPAAQQQ